MIITINTKEDSKEEIKRAIQMLMRLVEQHTEAGDFNPIIPQMNTDSPSAPAGIFGLFDNPSSTSPSQMQSEENKDPEDKIEIWEY